MTTTMAPMVRCPLCAEEFQKDDYYEMGEGSELECPKCHSELTVCETEMVMYWSIRTKVEYDAAQAKVEEYRKQQRETFLKQREEWRSGGKG